ncbi:hypothetical protein [Croceicoccus sediminis]|uniref:WapI family immunity protein n=1 Tax=Croceicoccus sediminis TaxID=2571150 RepID=UPI001183F44E|nr:hypothetical protein [Croceicoccus sediminis]
MRDEPTAAFNGTNGSLRIGVERYQFPDIVDDEWDSNWLIVAGEADLDGRSWSFRDPCLTTFEVERLANWLDGIAVHEPVRSICGFTEPNLEFECVSDKSVRISFSMEALPPWAPPDSDVGDIGFEVPIDNALSATASCLRRMLSRFPIRAGNVR